MPTIKDVARLAGVSIATASNVLNQTKFVSEGLRQSVFAAVAELGYQADFNASNLKRKRTMSIGVVLNTINLIFVSQVLKGIQAIADKQGFRLIMHSSDYDLAKEKASIQKLRAGKVDGIIIDSIANPGDTAYFEQLAALGSGDRPIPVVSLERNLAAHGIASIFVDNLRGGQMAARHLIEAGCRRIALINGLDTCITRDREAGYRLALQEAAIPCDEELVHKGDYTPVSGYRITKRLLLGVVGFDGLFACNDQMAIGALKALCEHQAAVPEQVRLIGFDNTFISSLVTPSLSTVNVPKYRLGETAARLLIDQIEKREAPAYREMPITIIARSSTGGNQDTGWELEDW